MLKRSVIVAAAIAALGCTESPVAVDTIDGPAFAVVTTTTTDVTTIPGGVPVADASATLRETGNGVAVQLKTSGLAPGHAFTVWAFSGGPPQFVGAHVVGGSGKATFAGRVTPPGDITHLVVRDHGPKLPGNAQFAGGPFGGCPPNSCASVQLAVF